MKVSIGLDKIFLAKFEQNGQPNCKQNGLSILSKKEKMGKE